VIIMKSISDWYKMELKMKTNLYSSLKGLYPYSLEYHFSSISKMIAFKDKIDELYKKFNEEDDSK
jgi:hypothetical protein